jgi:hypothetical protein
VRDATGVTLVSDLVEIFREHAVGHLSAENLVAFLEFISD